MATQTYDLSSAAVTEIDLDLHAGDIITWLGNVQVTIKYDAGASSRQETLDDLESFTVIVDGVHTIILDFALTCDGKGAGTIVTNGAGSCPTELPLGVITDTALLGA